MERISPGHRKERVRSLSRSSPGPPNDAGEVLGMPDGVDVALFSGVDGADGDPA